VADDKRFCPDCGSSNVEPDFRRTNVLGEMIFNQNKWVCNECGYTGIMPSGDPEDFELEEGSEDEETRGQKEEQQIEFEEKSHDTVDQEAGKAYFKYFVYILLPLTILYLLYLRII